MTIIAWSLYVCLTHSTGGLQCHEHKMAQMYHLSGKEVCKQAAAVIEEETYWDAYCLPVMREK